MTSIIALFQTPIGQLVLLGIGYSMREGIAWLLKQKRAAALAGVAQAAADAVNAGLAANNPQAAVSAAKASLQRDTPQIFNSLEAEADVLLAGHVAQLTTAPGGATVKMP
jgi:hypothetical protein